MSMIKRGAQVRLIQPVIQGEVMEAMTDGDQFGYRVKYKGEDGAEHERFFPAEKLEEVKPEQEAAQ